MECGQRGRVGHLSLKTNVSARKIKSSSEALATVVVGVDYLEVVFLDISRSYCRLVLGSIIMDRIITRKKRKVIAPIWGL